jgi:hypothetical protein
MPYKPFESFAGESLRCRISEAQPEFRPFHFF